MLLQDEFSKLGIVDMDSELAMRNTGGHMDIDYCSLIIVDQTGALECVFYTKSWNDEFEAIVPWVKLFGSWIQWEPNIKNVLSEVL